MKNISSALILFFILSSTNLFAQTTESSWAVGFGFSYPRMAAVDVGPKDPNYGGYISFQRNFNENVAIRVLAFYRNMLGKVPPVFFKEAPNGGPSSVKADWEIDEMSTTAMGGIFDVMYYFSISESVAPFVHFGGGLNYYNPDYTKDEIFITGAESQTTGTFDLGVGSEFGIGNDWKLKVDFSYFITAGGIDGINRKPDGYNYRSGIFGTSGDSYLSIDVGLLYYFGKNIIEKKAIPSGITKTEAIDYDRIENIVKKYIPSEIIREVIVEKPVPQESNWVLVGVNFNFNKSELRPESYPILLHAVKVLNSNPNLKVEIIGHSDNLGEEKFNLKISLERAQTVKSYLIGKGIDSNRLSVSGKGSAEPISDNNTANGRAMNRRIEFRVIK
jgi:OOP family OmpA-OmpF porin